MLEEVRFRARMYRHLRILLQGDRGEPAPQAIPFQFGSEYVPLLIATNNRAGGPAPYRERVELASIALCSEASLTE